ncbi:2487_t:CDS:2, partial [Racocetra persica]
ADANLYGALRQALEIRPSDLTWKDPEANMVFSDASDIVKNLKRRQKGTLLEPRENRKWDVPGSVMAKCDKFVNSFTNSNASRAMGKIFHDRKWQESETELVKVTDRILSTLGEIWSNPAFLTHASQSEGTYVAEVIIPLLSHKFGKPSQRLYSFKYGRTRKFRSKARRNIGMDEMRMGKKPDQFKKKKDDEVKLWRETLDGASFKGLSCKPRSNQFGVVGIQIAGTVMRLNILVMDSVGIPRYFHLDHTEIPL